MITVGELVARLLEGAGVRCAFGVVSIHNMPILDAFGRRGKVRFVPARGEAGAANMADAYTRVSGGIGVVVTSTGTGAGNAAGAMVEAYTAGTPLLHLTGQVDSMFIDRDVGYIHQAPDQLGMLRTISKAAYRVHEASTALETVREALRVAVTPPQGPVSVEIPIDIQQTLVPLPDASEFEPKAIAVTPVDDAEVAALVRIAQSARRPLLWLGRGAREAALPVGRLARMGWAVLTSIAGRGILPEDHPYSLGAFGTSGSVEAFLDMCDLLVVAGSRLRSNETLGYRLRLPTRRVQIDVDENARNRVYVFDRFVRGDATEVLTALADGVQGATHVADAFDADVKAARGAAEADLRAGLGPFAAICAAVEHHFGSRDVWVRDVTISNSTWGNRLPPFAHPRQGVHAVGGGIGQGLPMAIGAATATGGRVFALVGDGGLALALGELATLAQERLPVTLIVMNDRGYGVIRNIQDREYDGRRYFADLATPRYAEVAGALDMNARSIRDIAAFAEALSWSRSFNGPVLLDVDMEAIGTFAHAFAGPPKREVAT